MMSFKYVTTIFFHKRQKTNLTFQNSNFKFRNQVEVKILPICSKKLHNLHFQFAGLTVQKQKFGLATTIADVFGHQPIDGIMGLGWPALAEDNVVPPMQNLLDQLDKPIFTVWMDR